MAQYRRKPGKTIEAWQWNGEKAGEMPGVCQCETNRFPHLHTAHENSFRDGKGQIVFLSERDWIIPEAMVPDRYYPCKPDVFAETYEAVDTPEFVVGALTDAMLHGKGVIQMTRVDPAEMTVDAMVDRGVDRDTAEFIHGEQWTPEQVRKLSKGAMFEPIGDAAARVVKSLTVGADDALGGLMARKPTEDK